MRGTSLALACALVIVYGAFSQRCAEASEAYWLMTHAGANGARVGEYLTSASDPSLFPAQSAWDAATSSMADFGGDHASCLSTLADGRAFTYAYADATWSDTVTVYNSSYAAGEMMSVYLNFELDGYLSVLVSGTLPSDTTSEGRAAVTADVQSSSLGVIAHGYNMWSTVSPGASVMRSSGNWALGGAADPSISGWRYDNMLALPILVPNGVAFDLMAKISVATGAWLTYGGSGAFPGLGGYDITAIADFSHTMTLGGFTDASGNDIRYLGYGVTSFGPTFHVVPAPASVVLAAIGAALALASRRRIT